jgi:nucleolar protein 56
MKLVTTWFGTFMTDDEGQVLEKCLFPKDAHEIALRLETMQCGEVLAEEEELAAGRSIFVREKRLAILGDVMDFQQPNIRPEDYGFGQEILGMAMQSRGRDKVRASASPDEHIVQAIRTIDDLGKIINLMSERLHEWHELNFPELTKLVPESKYVELIAEYGDRNGILDSGKIDFDNSMGGEVTEADARAMQSLAKAMIATTQKKAEMEKYIELRMKEIAPNTSHLVGPLIGARLISLTGGLDRLSKLPASTIQLLGAEKALFKHIKDNAKPPKHGVIFQHPLIHRAPQWQRGKIARTFAGKISIAVKMDRFGGKFIGPELEADMAKRVENIKKQYPKPKVKGGYRKR